ncbi:MAG: class I SAM-dependent methyltransferase [Halodesulfurarchaeum sp.]
MERVTGQTAPDRPNPNAQGPESGSTVHATDPKRTRIPHHGPELGGPITMSHTFDPASAHALEGEARFRYLSRDELVGALRGARGGTVADIGSGTGFYTREVAPYVEHLYAVDVQDEMHDHFAEREIPPSVELVLAPASNLPFEDGTLDGLYTTMTYHEVEETAPAEFARVLRRGGSIVVADWSNRGAGKRGPPLGERKRASTASTELEAVGFTVGRARERPETFFIEATLE